MQGNPLPPAAQQDQIFASWIAFELPVGVTGLLLAAIYAATQSTLSTGLNSVAASWTLDIQARLTKKELSMEKQTKIGQYVSLIVGIFSIVVAIVLANGGVKSAYEWFNGFMGLVLGILIGTFILGAFTKVANTFGATLAFIAASAVMVGIKYFAPARRWFPSGPTRLFPSRFRSWSAFRQVSSGGASRATIPSPRPIQPFTAIDQRRVWV